MNTKAILMPEPPERPPSYIDQIITIHVVLRHLMRSHQKLEQGETEGIQLDVCGRKLLKAHRKLHENKQMLTKYKRFSETTA